MKAGDLLECFPFLNIYDKELKADEPVDLDELKQKEIVRIVVKENKKIIYSSDVPGQIGIEIRSKHKADSK